MPAYASDISLTINSKLEFKCSFSAVYPGPTGPLHWKVTKNPVHAAGGCGDKFSGTGQRPLQGGDVGSKRDGQAAHAPGVESTWSCLNKAIESA